MIPELLDGFLFGSNFHENPFYLQTKDCHQTTTFSVVVLGRCVITRTHSYSCSAPIILGQAVNQERRCSAVDDYIYFVYRRRLCRNITDDTHSGAKAPHEYQSLPRRMKPTVFFFRASGNYFIAVDETMFTKGWPYKPESLRIAFPIPHKSLGSFFRSSTQQLVLSSKRHEFR